MERQAGKNKCYDSDCEADSPHSSSVLEVKTTGGCCGFSVTNVEPILFFILFSSSLSGPILTNMLLVRFCEALRFPQENCTHLDSVSGGAIEQEIQPYVTRLSMFKAIIEYPLPALMSIFLGSWGDKYGRRPLILLAVAGQSLQYFLLSLYSWSNLPPLYVLFVSVPIALTGGTISLYSSVFCYISDVSKEKACTYRMAFAEGMIFVGLLLGTLIAPYVYVMFSSHGFEGVFSISCGCCIICLLYTYFFVPESVANREDRSTGLIQSLFNIKHLKDVIQTCFTNQSIHRRLVLSLLAVFSVLNLLSLEGPLTVLYLFTRNKFEWSLKEFSIYSDVGLLLTICGIILGTALSSKWLATSNEPLIAGIAFTSKVISYTLAGLSPQSWYMYASSAVGALSGVSGPLYRTILSKSVESKDIGKAFVFVSFFEAFVPLLASVIYSPMYNGTIHTFPGAFFLCSASLSAVGVVLMGVIFLLLRKTTDTTYHLLNNNQDNGISSACDEAT